MQEDLRRKTSIQFPTVTNTSNDVTLVFGSMTPMIEIPSTVVLRQLEEGIYIHITIIHTCVYMHVQLLKCINMNVTTYVLTYKPYLHF